MAYFHCLIGGGSSGGGYELTVTCDAEFAGTTITATDGVTTLTQTCPSSSPYEVVFEIPNGGTWTVSGTISGSTFTASIDIPDELELIAIPDGSTATPTDVIQTWLRCSGIFDKSYTTLNEVLADSVTLLALMSNDNAVDYLVRSTTWASGITADSTAMTDIGANNYCANTLLSDSTWAEAICNSTYFESVLNVKVPVMTSNTTPSGQASASATYAVAGYEAYRAFDRNNSTRWAGTTVGSSGSGTLAYMFPSAVKILYARIQTISGIWLGSASIQGSNNGSTWSQNLWSLTTEDTSDCFAKLNSDTDYKYYRLSVTTQSTSSNLAHPSIMELQFYGREDV